MRSPLAECDWVNFPVAHDERGNLSFIEGGVHIPFGIARVYYLYDLPPLTKRGGHAHRALSQVIIAISGSFDLNLDDGVEQRTVHLNQASRGYIIRPWIWRTLDNFSNHSVCLVLASHPYDKTDYIHDHGSFRIEAHKRLGLNL